MQILDEWKLTRLNTKSSVLTVGEIEILLTHTTTRSRMGPDSENDTFDHRYFISRKDFLLNSEGVCNFLGPFT